MKKAIFVLLTVVVLFATIFSLAAFADTPDFSAMTEEEITEIINAARNELDKRRILNNSNSENTNVDNTLDGWKFDAGYVSNDYYDIVETATYKNSIGYTIIIHKVYAKQDVSLSSTIIATAPDGSVIGKSNDDIVLTKGQTNYFRYTFESDVSSAAMSTQLKAKKDSFMSGKRNAVEMVQYNQAGDDLYITFRQIEDDIGYFAKFKLIFYNADRIVDVEDGYFSVYAENLSGAGTTDVASIWVYGTQFDKVEYIYEP